MHVTKDNSKERLHFLDGFRAIASILVVLHHSISSFIDKVLQSMHLPYLGIMFENFTQSGVPLFFVLSGIVLLKPYIRKQRKFETGKYFVRRFKRIYPAYLGALIFGYIIIVIIKSGPQTFYSNIWRWTNVHYTELLRQMMIINLSGNFYNFAWWSLQIEVVFYVLVPVFLVLFSFKKQLNFSYVLLVTIVVTLLSFGVQFFLSAYYPNVYNNDSRILSVYRFIDYPVCFVLGSYLSKFDFKSSAGSIFMIIGSVMILASYYYFPLCSAGYGFFYAGIIIKAFNSAKIRSWLDRPIMIWLGERSYSLFLTHFSAFYLTDYIVSIFSDDRGSFYGIVSRVIGYPLALLFAMLLFYFVERKQARGLVTDKIFWPWQLKRLKNELLDN